MWSHLSLFTPDVTPCVTFFHSCSLKTITLHSTDAEGRLTLADAIWFAQEKAGATVSDTVIILFVLKWLFVWQ